MSHLTVERPLCGRLKWPLDRAFPFRVYARGDCWEFRGSRHTGGYRTLTVDDKTQFAHRVAYEISKGPIPPGFDIDTFAAIAGAYDQATWRS